MTAVKVPAGNESETPSSAVTAPYVLVTESSWMAFMSLPRVD